MSDLIDRQYVLDKFKALCDACGEGEKYNGVMCGACNLDSFIREFEDIPSAEPERKWTPVTEALPKVRTDVMLAFEKNMAVGFYSHDCWNVNTGNGFYTGVFTDEDKPIAWMPLPESYRGEE